MTKKRTISSFLLFVFLIVFAHSIIPHHHHFNADDETYNRNTFQDDSHHDDFDKNILGKAFSLFQHEPGGVVIYHSAATENQALKKLSIESEHAFLLLYLLNNLYSPPLKHTTYYKYPPPEHYNADCKLLRAPPATALA